eukprot:1160628-Pelagomonas_calceolata.AAC.18
MLLAHASHHMDKHVHCMKETACKSMCILAILVPMSCHDCMQVNADNPAMLAPASSHDCMQANAHIPAMLAPRSSHDCVQANAHIPAMLAPVSSHTLWPISTLFGTAASVNPR